MEQVSFTTSDDVTIFGSFFPKSASAILLLHMMPATKESWNEFAEQLALEGLTVLAIDLRGHGQSTNSGQLDYQHFSNEQHQASLLDVTSSEQWLRDRQLKLTAIVGASIGANLAIVHQAKVNVPAVVALSAGINYYGVETIPSARQLADPQRLFLAAAENDMRSNGESCATSAKQIHDTAKISDKQLATFSGSDHGTDLLDTHPQLAGDIINWLKS